MMKSRKFFLTMFGLCLITLMTLLAGKHVALAALLTTFIGGILGVLGLYFSGNVSQKWVMSKAQESDNTVPVKIIEEAPNELEHSRGN